MTTFNYLPQFSQSLQSLSQLVTFFYQCCAHLNACVEGIKRFIKTPDNCLWKQQQWQKKWLLNV